MGRTLARDRAGWTKAVTLHCPGCNKRIGLLDEQIPGMVDDGLGTIEWTRLTNKAGEEINWWRVKCPRCSEAPRVGRESELLELVRDAKAQGLSNVVLGRGAREHPRPRTDSRAGNVPGTS